ncbi:MAG: hypothetical protein A2087_10110 [Spirochaetes bacterium GWD1_61_31]|nr:MAG: hypothetical protein A2Y37_01930 [Spirochaetes bacterium GWB1_60_80]OHD32034.1 MAG: hypothetical protein A2004_06330 [Spirochaetes bacterium GWC1_61_12]OHD40632.1 MAG: hypothetical protein A2087_10110 [Spirochaetes bacterium GWD1_61_31]OHD43904.1 MAG: hypothetical protein A2Y35_12460 [Spirochaetes bacterium GWE1_60_18]OHD59775.1 MAG: hypothetical protein A2Y32_02315 [Spirochaetes bacterium GWF1_60_12]
MAALMAALMAVWLAANLGAQGALGGSAPSSKRNILVIHSYNPGFQWTDDIHRAIFDRLGGLDDLEFYVEYMDANRYTNDDWLEHLIELFRHKYAERQLRFDVIIASDDNAFNFVLANRSELFFDAPLVFCGVNDVDPARLAGLSGVCGVNERKSMLETVELGLSLRPASRHLAVISGSRLAERRNLVEFQAVAPLLTDRLEITYLSELPAAALRQALLDLPPDSLVLFLSAMGDATGAVWPLDEGIRLALSNPALPVLVTVDHHVRSGMLGGMVAHGYAQGETAASLAARFLAGEPFEHLPLLTESPNRIVLDDKVLHRFGIDNAKTPIGTELLNLSAEHFMSDWQANGVQDFFGYELFNNHGAIMLLLEPGSGTIVDANRAAMAFYGFPHLVGMKITDLNNLSPAETQAAMEETRLQRRNFFEFRHRLADGGQRDVAIYTWPVRISNTELLFSIIFDISDRVAAEAEARRQEANFRGLILASLALALVIILALLVQIVQRRRAQKALEAELDLKTVLLDTIPNPVFFKDADGRYTGCNRAYEKISGIPQPELIGKTVHDIHPPDIAAVYAAKDAAVQADPASIQVYEWELKPRGGGIRKVLYNKAAILDSQQKLSGIVGVITDITDQKRHEEQLQQSLVEKQTLIKELYHRTKNNMQVISSIVAMQAIGHPDPALHEVLRDIDQRIRSMALVHQMLYNSGDLSRINFGEYLKRLFESVILGYESTDQRLSWQIKCPEILLLIDLAMPCALVVNELLTNSCKYAFPDRRPGTIELTVTRRPDGLQLYYRDDGVGLPLGFEPESATSLGLSMIRLLVEHQLDGSLRIDRNDGLAYTILFPDNLYSERVHA